MSWLVLLLACGGPGPGGSGTTASGVTGPTFALTVHDGYGGGAYPAGSRPYAFAAVDPQAAIVTGWTGVPDADAPIDPGEWNTAVAMPDHDLAVTPAIRAVDPGLHEEDVAGRTVWVAAPEAPRGLVMFFHGAAYNRGEIWDNAGKSLAMRLFDAGWEVVALDSSSAWSNGTGGWDASAGSADVDAAKAVVDALVARGDVAAGAPIVAWGMSSGGMFAHAFGVFLPADAVVAHCAAGAETTAGATDAPTLWLLAEADGTMPTAVTQAPIYAARLTGRGIPAEVYVHPRTPLYPERFARVAGIDAALSTQLVTELAATGVVGADGRFAVGGSQITLGLDLPSLAGLDAAQVTAVKAEIEIVAAEHELYDDAGARMVAFLDAI